MGVRSGASVVSLFVDTLTAPAPFLFDALAACGPSPDNSVRPRFAFEPDLLARLVPVLRLLFALLLFALLLFAPLLFALLAL